MCLSDLTSQTPKRQNPCKWTPKTLVGNTRNPLFYSIFCDLGPIFGQVGPVVGNALGHLMKAFPWIGPKSKNRT